MIVICRVTVRSKPALEAAGLSLVTVMPATVGLAAISSVKLRVAPPASRASKSVCRTAFRTVQLVELATPGSRVLIAPQLVKETEVSLLDSVTAVRPTVPVLVMVTSQMMSPAACSTHTQQQAHT